MLGQRNPQTSMFEGDQRYTQLVYETGGLSAACYLLHLYVQFCWLSTWLSK